jgi:hypothetical protein
MILVAGPYRSGTGDDPAKIAANVRAMTDAALQLYRAGHLPVLGEWLALPLVERAGSRAIGDAVFDQIFHPSARRLLVKCDACLRIGGPSQGADEMVAAARALGKLVYFDLAQIPRVAAADRVVHRGSCHCGAVRVEVEAPADLEAYECNCSMCERIGFLHLIVPASCFRLTQGREQLTTYTFNTGVAKHTFCKVCGVKVFYVPRSNPDGFSVNVRCLDRATIASVKVLPFDGKNWESAAGSVAELSRA